MADDNIIYQARLHWVIFFWPALWLGLALCGAIAYPAARNFALLMAGFSFIWGAVMWVTYQFCSLTIKKTQVILRTGFLVRQTLDFPLSKIESIDIQQSILGSLLRYGSLIITGTGGSRQMVSYINQPLTCRRYIEQLMHG